MALTKITSTNIGANAVTNTAIGYTPANKAGDTFTGNISLTSSTTPNLYIESSNTSVNQNLWFRSNGTDTFGIEAQSNTGGAGAFLSNRSPGGGINFRTTTSGASLQTAMTIDGAGRMTLPYQPSFFVSDPNSTSVTQGELVFTSASAGGKHNTGSHYSTSTGRFTAPVTGYYQMSYTIRANNTNNYFHPSIRINNASQTHTRTIWGGVLDYKSLTFTAVFYLASGDYTSVSVADGAGGSGTLETSQCSFSGRLVG